MEALIPNDDYHTILNVIKKYDLLSKKRHRHLIYKRAFVYNYLHQHKFTLTQIGDIFENMEQRNYFCRKQWEVVLRSKPLAMRVAGR